jgi:hypothetical protein
MVVRLVPKNLSSFGLSSSFSSCRHSSRHARLLAPPEIDQRNPSRSTACQGRSPSYGLSNGRSGVSNELGPCGKIASGRSQSVITENIVMANSSERRRKTERTQSNAPTRRAYEAILADTSRRGRRYRDIGEPKCL